MPRYEFHCRACGMAAVLRRPVDEMDAPATCGCGSSMARRFTPTPNIHIPIAFRQFQTGGAPGGGQISWSDVHGDMTERELAHLKDENGREIHVERTQAHRSQTGRSKNHADRRERGPARASGVEVGSEAAPGAGVG